MHASELLQLLLEVSGKASQIASVIRKEKALLELLIEEKPGKMKNEVFFQDFKTFADVLIQETVCHFISKKIPHLSKNIYGEESNTFTNVSGESITVQVCKTEQETKELLKKILDNNDEAANLLAKAVHEPSAHCNSPTDLDVDIDTSDCGVWIDPIDATGQYIKGETGVENEHGLLEDGIQCVVILIGLFKQSTGRPILGVASQPFAHWNPDLNSWTGNTVWGICYNDFCATSLQQSEQMAGKSKPKIVMSKSETKQVQTALSSKYNLISASGAGYKILVIASGLANAYVLSHCSIYRWDCCAMHAILLAMNGGIISYKHAIQAAQKCEGSLSEADLERLQLSYVKAAGAIASRRHSLPENPEGLPGIIAYRTAEDALAIIELLK